MQVSPSDPLSSPLQRILRRCSVRNSCYTYANRALIFSFFTLLSSLNSLLPFLKSALSFQSRELLSLHRLFPVTLSLQSSFFYPTASLFNVSHTGNSHRREAVASFLPCFAFDDYELSRARLCLCFSSPPFRYPSRPCSSNIVHHRVLSLLTLTRIFLLIQIAHISSPRVCLIILILFFSFHTFTIFFGHLSFFPVFLF